MPTANAQQEVTIVEKLLGKAQIGRDPVYGNTIAYIEATARAGGVIPFEVTYKVQRKEVHTDPAHGVLVPAAAGEPLERYLQPDVRVPVTGKPLELLQEHVQNMPQPYDPLDARIMFDAVRKHLSHKPSTAGAGQGDAAWACEHRLGDSADLSSVFIAMARGRRIPAKFEIGFAIPAKPGPVADRRARAWFTPDGKGWVPADIAAGGFGSLDENRVSFSVGRDIELVPRQNGPPLNFFIDPYVEVDGKAYPQAKIQRRYSFADAAGR